MPFGSIKTIEDEEEHLRSHNRLMCYLHTLNVPCIRVHNVHYALHKSKAKLTDNPVITTG
jgi:hypothetical protein